MFQGRYLQVPPSRISIFSPTRPSNELLDTKDLDVLWDLEGLLQISYYVKQTFERASRNGLDNAEGFYKGFYIQKISHIEKTVGRPPMIKKSTFPRPFLQKKPRRSTTLNTLLLKAFEKSSLHRRPLEGRQCVRPSLHRKPASPIEHMT